MSTKTIPASLPDPNPALLGSGDRAFRVASGALRLINRPDLAPRIAEIREGMRRADGAHPMTLAMVRHAAGLTQQDVAERMNVTQGAVARTERRGDVLLSTLRSYLAAAAAHNVTIVAELADGSIAEVALAELADAQIPLNREFQTIPAHPGWVVRQNGRSPTIRWIRVLHARAS